MDETRESERREIGGPQAHVEHAADRVVDQVRLARQSGGVPQQHRRRGDRAERIRQILAGDVGRRPVHWFVEIDFAADRCRRQHPDRSGQRRGLIAQDVAEQVLGEDDVEVRGLHRQAHRARVHVHVREADVGEVVRDVGDRRPPQPRGFQHVRLVYRGHETPPPARLLEPDPGDTLDLRARVAHRVERLVCGTAARLPEVQAAEQLADDQDIGAGHALGAIRSRANERSVGIGRAEIREPAQCPAQGQQRRLRAFAGLEMIECGITDRAEQHSVGAETTVERVRRQGDATVSQCRSADEQLTRLEVVSEGVGDQLQNAKRLSDDLRADSIPGKQRDLQTHGRSSGAAA